MKTDTQQPIKFSPDVDALLGAATNRALKVSHAIAQMRDLHAKGRADDYWRAAVALAAELHVLGLALNGANHLLLEQVQAQAQMSLGQLPKGGYLN
jgi:hypothetical protein